MARSKRGPSLSTLKTGTHRGRPTRTKMNPGAGKRGGMGVRATGLRANPREVAPTWTRVTPTPSGPEPHWPAG